MTPSSAFQPRALAARLNDSYRSLPAPQLPRSRFDLSCTVLGTMDPAYLVPVWVEEVLPSDTFEVTPRFFARFLTSDFPVMDTAYLDWFAFFIPNRLVWENWQRFMGERDNPSDSIDYVVPVICSQETGGYPWYFDRGGLADAFGYPVGDNNTYSHEPDDPSLPIALPHRAYHLTVNGWFRDQNLQSSFPVPLGDGPDDPRGSYGGFDYDALRKRGKRHTYITSALPWPQKGDAVSVPLGLTAPVVGNGETLGLMARDGVNPTKYFGALFDGQATPQSRWIMQAAPSLYDTPAGTPMPGGAPTETLSVSQSLGVTDDPEKSGLHALLDEATAITINMLREAIAVQQVLEADARGGTRYVEILRNIFGAISPDFRLQRPEYVGGGSSRVNMVAVSNTGEDTGELTGVAVAGANGSFTYSAVEHGLLMILVNVRANITFQNRLDRRWTRRTRFDYFRPELAHLGEQAIKNREVCWDVSQDMDGTWGYIGRFDEYRYAENRVFGMMRSDDPLSLDAWHYALDFDSLPALSASFIEDQSDVVIKRTVKENSLPIVKLQGEVKCYATRILPVYGIPGLTRL